MGPVSLGGAWCEHGCHNRRALTVDGDTTDFSFSTRCTDCCTLLFSDPQVRARTRVMRVRGSLVMGPFPTMEAVHSLIVTFKVSVSNACYPSGIFAPTCQAHLSFSHCPEHRLARRSHLLRLPPGHVVGDPWPAPPSSPTLNSRSRHGANAYPPALLGVLRSPQEVKNTVLSGGYCSTANVHSSDILHQNPRCAASAHVPPPPLSLSTPHEATNPARLFFCASPSGFLTTTNALTLLLLKSRASTVGVGLPSRTLSPSSSHPRSSPPSVVQAHRPHRLKQRL